MIRHLITSEYPPQAGGVSDYTQLVARGLAAAGDEVHVWCPGGKRSEIRGQNSDVEGPKLEARERKEATLVVHREFGRFTPGDLRRVGKMLDQFSARRLLVQWVPHGYGYRSMNLAFCFWLWQRAKFKHDQIELMVHEPFLAFGEGSRKQDAAAAVHRFMVVVLLNAASRVWVSIPDWEKCLRPFVIGKGKAFDWLPVPSNIPVIADPEGIKQVRAQYAFPDALLLGHFGAYDHYLSALMLELLPPLLTKHDKLSVLLVGKGSLELRDWLIKRHPDFSQHVRATGALSAADTSRHISACDLMLQPYQDGVSGRRGSVMAALSHGVPVVTTRGRTTEEIWATSKAVSLVETGDIGAIVAATQRLLSDKETRSSLSNLGANLYRERFELGHIISALRQSAQPDPDAGKLRTAGLDS